MQPNYLRGYLARITREGNLQMRDPNDGSRARYQYADIGGQLYRRRLPNRGKTWRDGTPLWEPITLRFRHNHPIADYLRALQREPQTRDEK